MARNGSGTYTNPYPNFVSGTVISSTEVDTNNSQIATALTQSIAVDGQAVVTADLPLATHKFTGMKVGSASTDSLSLGQAQAEAFVWCGTAGGGADAITLTPAPPITAYAAGQRFVWMASSSTNTTATTVAISGLGAIALQDNGAALTAGQHAASKMFMGILNTTSTVQIMQVQVSGNDIINGNTQFNGTITVGVNDTGHDVTFYGATSGAYMLWDESTDDLKLVGAAGLIVDGVTTHGGNVLSDTDSTDSLGSSTVRWAGVWTDAINGGTAPSHFEGKNRIDNPSGVINQRGAQTGLVTGFAADRWYFGTASPSAVSTNTVSGYIEVDVTTADTSIAAGDLAYLQQSIEGFNTSDLLIGTSDAKTITISFTHKHTKTGTNCVALTNSAANRSYIFEYTQSSSNAPETHSETVTLDTTGTWIGDTNGIGLKIIFGAMSGTNYHGAADTWLATNDFATSNQVNNMDSTSNYFRITDVQLEIGTVATPLEYEHYEATLAKCQRYLPTLKATADDQAMGLVGQPYSTTVAIVPILFPYKPRASITGITISAADHFALTGAASNRIDSTAVVYGNGGLDGIWISVTVASGIVAGNAVTLWSANAGAYILFTGAEL
tara:strand:- start:156 stop:1988 length:1833 start_codon:yes stop_codon:yes gene_type:complete